MISDFRYVLRSLWRAKGFTIVVVLTLALGIGSAAAIFGVVDWVLFRSDHTPADLVIGGVQTQDGQTWPWLMGPEIETYRALPAAFIEHATAVQHPGNVVLGDEPVDTWSLDVSANFFPLLGIAPSIGRGFLPNEDEHEADVVVITDWFWTKHFQKAPDVLGRQMKIGDRVCTIVGVLPRDAQPPMLFFAHVYRPRALRNDPAKPWEFGRLLLLRLRPGVTRAAAQEIMRSAKVAWPASMGSWPNDRKAALLSGQELRKKFMRSQTYWLLVGAVGFLYAIACINSTNLLLVRALGRKRELSVRLALGGTRRQLVRLLLIEAAVISIASSAVGALIANWLRPVFLLPMSSDEPFKLAQWSISWRTAGVLVGLSFVSAMITAFIPALRTSRTDLVDGLKDGGAAVGESPRLAALRAALLFLQAAFAVVLLTGAGLMVQSIRGLDAVSVGFAADELVRVQCFLEKGYEPSDGERLQLLKGLQAALTRVPGVADVTFSSDTLLSGREDGWNPLELKNGKTVKVTIDCVADNFLSTAGVTLKRGRMVNENDKIGVLINEALARAAFGDEDPIGQYLKPQGAKPEMKGFLVLGVVSDTRDQLRKSPLFHVYQPAATAIQSVSVLYVRTHGKPSGAVIGQLKHAVYAHDARVVTSDVTPITEQRRRLTWAEHLLEVVLSVLSGIALLLTVGGLFSVLAYSVDCRMSEFGVRMALGASREQIVRLVLRRGLTLAAIGVLVGVGASIGLSRFLSSLLFETPPYDPMVLGSVAGLLLLVSVVAAIWPAHRATKADVAKLLRSE